MITGGDQIIHRRGSLAAVRASISSPGLIPPVQWRAAARRRWAVETICGKRDVRRYRGSHLHVDLAERSCRQKGFSLLPPIDLR